MVLHIVIVDGGMIKSVELSEFSSLPDVSITGWSQTLVMTDWNSSE
jgi:hypothetical protein